MKNIKVTKVLLFAMLMILLEIGCFYDKQELLYPASSNTNCDSINATFSKVQPIIAGRCAISGCHNSGSMAGGIVLETYAQIQAKIDRINQRVIVDKTMPPGSPLSSNEIAILKCWIASGSLNN